MQKKYESDARQLLFVFFILLSFSYIVTGARQLATAIDFWTLERRMRKNRDLPAYNISSLWLTSVLKILIHSGETESCRSSVFAM